jgi:hypothetical protein
MCVVCCSPNTVEMTSLGLKGPQRCCQACHEYLSKGKSSSLERVLALMSRAEEESMQTLATKELLEYCAGERPSVRSPSRGRLLLFVPRHCCHRRQHGRRIG